MCQSADEHFFDPAAEILFMNELLRDDGILYITHPIMDLDKDLSDLANENKIRSNKADKESVAVKARLNHLRKSYHIDHLQYIMPKMFVNMILRSGFKEMKVGFRRRQILGQSALRVRNMSLFIRSLAKYWFFLVPWKSRKVEHLFRKVATPRA